MEVVNWIYGDSISMVVYGILMGVVIIMMVLGEL